MPDLSRIGEREKLKVRREPHWQRLRAGCFLGYRPSKRGGPGTWIARIYDEDTRSYRPKSLGDFGELPGNARFAAAKKEAEALAELVEAGGEIRAKVETVAGACRSYAEGRPEAESRFKRYVYDDPIGKVKLEKLRRRHLADWRKRLEDKPALVSRNKGKEKRTRPRAPSTINRDMASVRAALTKVMSPGTPNSEAAWQEALKAIPNANGRRTLYLDREQRRKLVGATPLSKQMVLPGDSVLGVLSHEPDPGLRTTYRELIEKAFHDQYWNSPGRVIQFNAASAPMKMADQQDPRTFRLNNGKGTVRVKSSQILAADEYTQMEANFAFFFGLAVQLYQATLVSDDTRYDRFREGSLSLNPEEQRGLEIFMNEGRCIQCHGGSLFTNGAIDVVQGIDGVEEEGMIEAMPVATGAMTLYDTGFYNIAVRPTSEDLGRGGTAPFVNPLTGELYPLSFTRLAWLKDVGLLPEWYRDLVPLPAAGIYQDAVDGAMKTPGLRNVELTGPYFRNGDSATLMQVIDLYTRGGNFPRINQDNLSPLMGELVTLQGNEADQKALVAFLLTLTDDRVKYEQAPFDHPQLFVVNGHNDLTLEDELVEIPAVDAEGRRDPLRPFLAPDGVDAYTFHTTP